MSWFSNILNQLTRLYFKQAGSLGDTQTSSVSPQVSKSLQVSQSIKGSQNAVIGIAESGSKIQINFGQSKREPTPFGVPYQRNRFFSGRQSVLEHLHQQLFQDTITAITQVQAISGLGGIGKTQTVVEYAYRHYFDQTNYDYVFWVNADTEINLATSFASLVNQIALPVTTSSQDENIRAVHQWLATHDHWLLIIDNANTPDLLHSYIPKNPNGKVLITSRASVFDQFGIDSPLRLDVLSEEEAIDLLFCRTKRKRTGDNINAAIKINQELDGLPLALEQASAFIARRKISFRTYLSTYQKRGLSQLEEVKAQTGQYPSSVLRTWKINCEALAEEQPDAAELLKFSAFLAPEMIPYNILETGAKYLGEEIKNSLLAPDKDKILLAIGSLLDSLCEYSLVKWDPDQQSYSVHRLVQSVVYEELTQEARVIWIDKSIRSVVAAYPGSDYKYWQLCTQLLPHWLKVIDNATEMKIESQALGSVLNQSGNFLANQGQYREAESLLKRALTIRQRLLNEDHRDIALSLNNLASLYKNQGRYSEAAPLFKEALSTRQRVLKKNHPDIALSLNNLASLYKNQGHYGEAENLYQEALSFYKNLFGEEHPDVANTLNNLASLYKIQGRYSEAKPLYQEALSIYKNFFGQEHPDIANSLSNLASLYKIQSRYRDSELLSKEALSIYTNLFGQEHPNIANTLSNLASLYKIQSRYRDSEILFKEALSIYTNLFGEGHIDAANTLNNLASLYKTQGRYSEAEPLFKKALQLYKNLLGKEHPDVAACLNNLASLYKIQERYSKAERLFEEALSTYLHIFGEEHPDVASALNNLASLYKLQERYSEAEPLLLKALYLHKLLLDEDHPNIASTINNLAGLYKIQGRYKEAELLFKEALAIRQKIFGEGHPTVALSLNNLAMLYQQQRRYKEAKPLLQKALMVFEKKLGARHPSTLSVRNNLLHLAKLKQ